VDYLPLIGMVFVVVIFLVCLAWLIWDFIDRFK